MAGVLAVNLTRTVLMIVTVSSAGVLIPVSGPVATWQSVWYRDLRPVLNTSQTGPLLF